MREKAIRNNELPRCPECNRKPKVIVRQYRLGVECVIRCKPFFSKRAHAQIVVIAQSEEEAMKKAQERWTERASCANLPVW